MYAATPMGAAVPGELSVGAQYRLRGIGVPMALHERQSSFISSPRILDKGISTSKIGFEGPLDIVSCVSQLDRFCRFWLDVETSLKQKKCQGLSCDWPRSTSPHVSPR